jgi:hypothetical protein
VSAFNHPVNLIVHQVMPAVAAGCPFIVKPSADTPLSCLRVVALLHEAGLPPEWGQAMLVERDVAEALVTDARTAFFSFVGSARVGWALRAKLAPGARCSLEHGGAAPVIVEPDAVLETALPAIVKGGFYHAGQVCVSVQRVYAHRRIADEVARRLAEMAAKLRVGDPTKAETEVGPLIREGEVKRVASWVDEAVQAGAKLLTGGRALGNNCYAPTVLLDPPDSARVSREEVFGPVVCVYAYDDIAEAFARANALPYSFQAAVFTQDIDQAMRAYHHLDASAVMVNDHTAFRVDWMPFAGCASRASASAASLHVARHAGREDVRDQAEGLSFPNAFQSSLRVAIITAASAANTMSEPSSNAWSSLWQQRVERAVEPREEREEGGGARQCPQRVPQVEGEQRRAGRGGAGVGRAERDVLGEREQQQEEDGERRSHQQVLHRVQPDSGHRLGQRECREGEEHEEEGVLGGAVRQRVDVHRIEEDDAGGGRRGELAFRGELRPRRLAAGRDAADAPRRLEAIPGNRALVGRPGLAEGRMRPVRRERDLVALAHRRYAQARSPHERHPVLERHARARGMLAVRPELFVERETPGLDAARVLRERDDARLLPCARGGAPPAPGGCGHCHSPLNATSARYSRIG